VSKLLLFLVILMALLACTTATPAPEITMTRTTPAAAVETPTPDPQPTQAQASASASPSAPSTATPDSTTIPSPGPQARLLLEFADSMTAETTWAQALAVFTRPEQDCVWGALDQHQPDSILEESIMATQAENQELMDCLDTQGASYMTAGITAMSFKEQGMVLGKPQVNCLQTWAADFHLPLLQANKQQEAALHFMDEVSVCLAGALVPFITEQIGQSAGGLDSAQENCAREVLSSSPPTLLLRSFYRIRDVGMYPGMEESLTTRLAQCVPELFEDLPPSSRPISVPVEISDFLEDHRIWHLAHNLLFIAHWDNESKKWFVLDVGGEFTTDQLTMPPGQVPPAPREVRELTRLESGKVYDFRMRWKGNVDLMGQRSDDWFFHAGSNFIVWP